MYANVRAREDLNKKVCELRDELLQTVEEGEEIFSVLEEKGDYLFRSYPDGSALVELLKQLYFCPQLALEVIMFLLLLSIASFLTYMLVY